MIEDLKAPGYDIKPSGFSGSGLQDSADTEIPVISDDNSNSSESSDKLQSKISMISDDNSNSNESSDKSSRKIPEVPNDKIKKLLI